MIDIKTGYSVITTYNCFVCSKSHDFEDEAIACFESHKKVTITKAEFWEAVRKVQIAEDSIRIWKLTDHRGSICAVSLAQELGFK